jgi:asparagine synthase (glutamine-hydrolysing)
MFAFAIWDSRTGEMLLARDQIGIKPLYFTQTPLGFLFASELKALLAEGTVDRTISPEAVEMTLSYLWTPSPNTILSSVQKLEPGQALTVVRGKVVKSWAYYNLPIPSPKSSLTDSETENRLQNMVRRAVRKQLVSDVPVGAMLSGGLDSSAIVAFAREALPDQSIECFTIGVQGGADGNEGQSEDAVFATQVARHLNVNLNILPVGPDMASRLQKVIYHLDEPNPDPSSINVLLISELAREKGVKVLLSGTGGDDLFGGYRRHLALKAEGAWAWLPRSFRGALSRWARSIDQVSTLRRRIAKALWYAEQDRGARLPSYFRWADDSLIESLRGPYLKERAADWRRSSIQLPASISAAESFDQMLYIDLRHFLADHNLNYTDKLSMAAGVEVRVPLLDVDLVQFAASTQISHKIRRFDGKHVLKRAVERYLPGAVVRRSKVGFGAPVRHWLRNELADLVGDVLSDESLARRGLFDPAGVRKLRQLDKVGRIDGSNTIFSLVCISLWMQAFLE